MMIYEAIENFFKNEFGRKTLVVSSDSESRAIKAMFFELGAEVVSDRDVVTLDYLLNQILVQKKGLKIVDDLLFPFLVENDQVGQLKETLSFVRTFPDPFLEMEIKEVIEEYFSTQPDLSEDFDLVRKASSLVKRTFNEGLIPRSFISIGLRETEAFKNCVFLDSVYEELPEGLRYEFEEQRLSLNSHQNLISKRHQIDIFKELKEAGVEFSHLNFNHQIDEVRFVLNQLSENENSDIEFLYPKGRGYEKLFYLYQREFFDEQVIYYVEPEEFYLDQVLISLQYEMGVVETKHNNRKIANNRVSFKEKLDHDLSLNDLLKRFEGKFSEVDLNLISSVYNTLDSESTYPIDLWVELLSEIVKSKKRKEAELKTDLPLYDFKRLSPPGLKRIFVLGWCDDYFKKKGERVFSTAALSALELDLGMNFRSLNSSTASELLKNPIFLDKEVEKTILYSSQSADGSSLKPGVFKILSDLEESFCTTEREHKLFQADFHEPYLTMKNKKISASSLQRYDECPYKFYLEKVLGLSFEDEEDYFLSPKEEGLIIHRGLEELDLKDFDKERFREVLSEMALSDDTEINSFRQVALNELCDRIWSILLEEKSYVEKVGVERLEKETFFSFYADSHEKKFSKEKGDFKINGLIDRIDQGPNGGVILYDYKRGDSGSVSMARYSGSKISAQLFLYCIAIDHGFLEDFRELHGFQYINIKEYKRSKGFVFKGAGDKWAKEVPRGSALNPEKYQEKIDLFLEKFWSLLDRIQSCDFEPRPNQAYSNPCESCRWVGQCKSSETFL